MQHQGAAMSITITDVIARDIRFPTSKSLDGSDAMNPDPDYSAAYVVLKTDSPSVAGTGDRGSGIGSASGPIPDPRSPIPGLEGHGLTFTIGRGTEVCVAAVNALKTVGSGRD